MHRTVTRQGSTAIMWRPGPNRRNELRQDTWSTWACACGESGGGATREEARRAARRHREQAEGIAALPDLDKLVG